MASESSGRGGRTTRIGEVVSRSGDKTIVVEVTRRVRHPFYKRYVNRRKRFHAHDEANQCRVGDRVRIAGTRPLSRLKRWRLVEILYRKAVEVLEASASDQPAAGGEKAMV
ncbi:MAG: 30S ribosomal protein S17 [Terriglobia bacterium]